VSARVVCTAVHAVAGAGRDTGVVSGERTDFFVSHAGADRAWAEWVAWQLEQAGYTVELDVWDWAAGRDFVVAMSDALDRADRVVALFSAAYFDRSRYTTEEWSAATAHVPGAEGDRLVPVRVEEVPGGVPAVLRRLVSRDLFGLGEEQARQVLLEAVAGPRRPDQPPAFPGHGGPGGPGRLGGTGPRLPGAMPRVWNIPARNQAFTGRDGLLVAVREALLAQDQAVVRALYGMGGVGKTQLAAEYAHRFARTYDLAWWVNSEQGGLIGDQFAALGLALGCSPAGTGTEQVRPVVLAELRERDRWLLVFDNAASPADVTPWLPGGGGHVLITTRERGWTEVAAPVEVDVLARPESVAILQARVSGLGEADAGQLAAELGDLPLGIAQAAGFMAETGMPAGQYLSLLRTRAREMLDLGASGCYPRSLATTTQVIAERLASEDPAAADLARLCAFLAPEPIPDDLFTGVAGILPGGLAARAADPLAWRQTLGRLARQSLARIDQRGLQMHRLTQAILRDLLTPAQAAATRQHIEAILVAGSPGDGGDPATWPRWARLMPHVLAAAETPVVRRLVCDACRYLLARGDARTGHELTSSRYRQWRDLLGDDHEDMLAIAYYLAWALRLMGRYAEARDLDQDTLDHRRRVLGEDHPDTLDSASVLAVDLRHLGDVQAARDLDQDTLARKLRVLGEDHPATLASATNLAIDLRRLGDVQAARDRHQDTLARKRRVLGEDHPDTLAAASELSIDLRNLEQARAARDLDQDTLDRRRRVLGEDHPDTLASASELAVDLRDLGEVRAARDLDRDTLDRRRRVLGEDHPDTLRSARSLASDLYLQGEVQAARDLDQDTLARYRRVLGEDHPDTLTCANNLAVDLRDLGEVQAARDLDRDTLHRRRRVLGEDHPDALRSARSLAIDLRTLGEADE
jgi:tetratricopeptide (TPR) repeat protein